jgi:hypothetical protein
MNKRVWIGGGIVVAGAAAFFLLRGGSEGTASPHKKHRDPSVAFDVKDAKPEDPLLPAAPQFRKPKTWVDPVSGATNREMVDAVPDQEAAAREELLYRVRRLRLSVSDAAAQCWTGGDSKEQIHIRYTLVVDKEVVRAEAVSATESTLTDPKVQACIMDAVRDMRTLADKVPDMKQQQELFMSMHDLWVRNRAFDGDKHDKQSGPTAPEATHELPPAQPAPSK